MDRKACCTVPRVRCSAEAFEKPRAGEKHQFRIIVSPEDAAELDLTLYVRRLMAQVEQDLGRKVEWAAVNHYNTEHPHAHLVIRGVDREGRELRLERSYISNGLRSRGQEIATEELGPRLDLDVRRAREREVTQERFTSLDRELERRAVADRVQARTPRPTGRLDESLLIARLQHLESLRLAERVGPASWTLSPGWKDELRELGTRGDILKQIHRAAPGDRARYRIVRVGQPLDVDRADEPVVHLGRVASKGLSDELKGSFYVVLETPTGHAYHLPLDARTAEELRPGDLVTFATRREPAVRPVDREIAQAAAARGGSYAPEPMPTARRTRTCDGCDGWSVRDSPLPRHPAGGRFRQTCSKSSRRDISGRRLVTSFVFARSPRLVAGTSVQTNRRWMVDFQQALASRVRLSDAEIRTRRPLPP
jgi:type IV secretory pathway VirD2 relaxase